MLMSQYVMMLLTAVGLSVADDVIVSPSVNLVAVLLVPVLTYFTYSVSGSEDVTVSTLNTSATTPDELL